MSAILQNFYNIIILRRLYPQLSEEEKNRSLEEFTYEIKKKYLNHKTKSNRDASGKNDCNSYFNRYIICIYYYLF